ncbi:MAG: rhomboid family intramembrane serine protease [Herpetosiphonaceae bacterium]|nr:rhomboid family intramembrane serine protease [Herpetosiphonaceae bacterium]
MSDQPPRSDDLNEIMRRLEREFQQREHASIPDELEQRERPSLEAPHPVPGVATPMPPQGRSVRIALPTSRPRIVYGILALNVVMLLVTMLVQQRVHLPFTDQFLRADQSGDDTFSVALYILGAKWSPAIVGGQYWRLLTPMILHGGLIHLLFNSYALYILGPQVERVFGTWRFLVIYLIAGFAGNIASFVIAPSSLAIGASGAIFGLIGALAAWSYAARDFIGRQASQAQLRQLIGVAVFNLILGFTIANIDNSAHIGGLLAGGLAGLALAPHYAVDQRLYPPVVQTTGRGAIGWVSMLGLLLLLVAIAGFTIRVRA